MTSDLVGQIEKYEIWYLEYLKLYFKGFTIEILF